MACASFFAFAATLGTDVAAQQSGPAEPHVGHLTSGFTGAPEGRGLVVTAAEEANTAMMHANFAAGDPSNLDAMKTHVAHVLHALDPEGRQGPGLGFGLRRAAEEIAAHIDMAMSANGASESVRTHGPDLRSAARAVAARADRIAELGQRVLAAATAAEAAPLVEEMRVLALELDTGEGNDLNAGQGGMTHVEAQAYELLSAAGLLRVLH
jgi:alkanesulfonate monooxygenase SsuD/methylene tetrahydromethanopterin reductase-like flavin-dependent oxidoreductase (luciferase family)